MAKQNNKENTKRLAAQRQIYTDAKNLQFIEIILTIPVVLTIALISNLFPAFKPFEALIAIVILILDLTYFEPTVKILKEKAAKIQELFDCSVLELRWNKTLCGSKPEEDDIALAYDRYKNRTLSLVNLENWYSPEVHKLPLNYGRLACQKINCWWDSNLRQTYNFLILSSAIICVLILLLFALLKDTTVPNLVLSIFSLLPILNFLSKQYNENKCASQIECELKKLVDSTWKEIEASSDHLSHLSRDLQNEIFNYRRSNPLIPDFFYYFYRTQYEDNSQKIIQHLVEQES